MNKLIQLKRKTCLLLLYYIPLPHLIRKYLLYFGGVNLKDLNDVSIGQRLSIDTLYPDNIYIGKHVHITVGCSILTHTLDTSHIGIHWKKTKVIIEDNCFIGTNSIICNNVRIGENCIVGAGSIVTKDIPANEIWAGNPAKFIKKREFNQI